MTQGPSVLPCPSPIPRPTSQVLDPRQTLADVVKNPPDSCRCLWWVQFFMWWRMQCWRQSLRTLSGPAAAHQAPRVSEHEGTRTEHSHVQMQTIVALVLLLLPTYKLSSPGLLEYLLLSRSVQSCLTLCNLKPSSPPGASVRGIFQARILERVAILLLQGIFPIQGRTRVSWDPTSRIGRWGLYHWAARGALHGI